MEIQEHLIKDIALASFLHSREVILVEVRLIDTYRCSFRFIDDRVSALIAEWGTGELNTNAREYWWSYRHLLGLAKAKEREAQEVGK